MNNTTLLAFDFGMKYIGVAVGQTITGNAAPLQSIKAKDGIPQGDVLEKIFHEWQPKHIVVGLPLNMDGTEQPLTHAAKKFGNRLANRFKVQVHFQDERLTTTDAKSFLFDQGGYRNLKKDKVDNISACLILENFMAEHIDL